MLLVSSVLGLLWGRGFSPVVVFCSVRLSLGAASSFYPCDPVFTPVFWSILSVTVWLVVVVMMYYFTILHVEPGNYALLVKLWFAAVKNICPGLRMLPVVCWFWELIPHCFMGCSYGAHGRTES
jgi:hypothetical protein